MKLSKIFALTFLCFWLTMSSFSQTISAKYEISFVITDRSTDTPYTFYAPTHEVVTANGNFLKSIRIKIPADHALMKNFGPFPNKLFEFNYLFLDVNSDGIYNAEEGDIQLTDAIAKLNKSGNLHITFHLNGAGTYLPLGW